MKFFVLFALVCLASAKTISKASLKSPLAGLRSLNPTILAETPSAPIPYAFEYNSQFGARQESSDGQAVRGSYSIAGENGQQRVVNYIADKDGFRASIASNEFGSEVAAPADVSLAGSAPVQSPLPVEQAPLSPIAQTPLVSPAFVQSPFIGGEASAEPYAFEYSGPLGSRKESSDGRTVRGFYTIAGDNGQQRIVNYVADKDGFRAAVATNEFGTESQAPANVALASSQPKAEEIAKAYGPRPVVLAEAPIVQQHVAALPLDSGLKTVPVVQRALPVAAIKTPVLALKAPVKPVLSLKSPVASLKAPALPVAALKAPALPIQRLEQSIDTFEQEPQKLDQQISEMYEQEVKRNY